MSKHTPGPWIPYACRYSDSENEIPSLWQIRQGSTGDIVATTAQYGVHSGAPLGKVERGANAALLAAAPELLGVAKQAHAAFGYLAINASTKADRDEFKRREQAALVAITKAEGL